MTAFFALAFDPFYYYTSESPLDLLRVNENFSNVQGQINYITNDLKTNASQISSISNTAAAATNATAGLSATQTLHSAQIASNQTAVGDLYQQITNSSEVCIYGTNGLLAGYYGTGWSGLTNALSSLTASGQTVYLPPGIYDHPFAQGAYAPELFAGANLVGAGAGATHYRAAMNIFTYIRANNGCHIEGITFRLLYAAIWVEAGNTVVIRNCRFELTNVDIPASVNLWVFSGGEAYLEGCSFVPLAVGADTTIKLDEGGILNLGYTDGWRDPTAPAISGTVVYADASSLTSSLAGAVLDLATVRVSTTNVGDKLVLHSAQIASNQTAISDLSTTNAAEDAAISGHSTTQTLHSAQIASNLLYWSSLTVQDPTNGLFYWQPTPVATNMIVKECFAQAHGCTGTVYVLVKAMTAEVNAPLAGIEQDLHADANGVSDEAISGASVVTNGNEWGFVVSNLSAFAWTNQVRVNVRFSL